MYCLCTHNNYTKRYTDSHADTRTYRQAIGQAQCRQTHTDRRLPWVIHCNDWLYATCVDYSKSKINDIYTEVISFFSVVIDTYQSQFMVNVDRWSLICLYFVSHRQLLEKAGKSRWALCVCVCIYSVSILHLLLYKFYSIDFFSSSFFSMRAEEQNVRYRDISRCRLVAWLLGWMDGSGCLVGWLHGNACLAGCLEEGWCS